jgi:SAM-dependent methyltransferase
MADPLFEEWRVYEKLLIHDYMDHRAFFGRLRDEIRSRFDRPIAILDLGCGDVAPMLPLLRELPVARYVGVDESEAALAIAADRLRPWGISTHLLRRDLRAAITELTEQFDVIVASFALHHLADPADKRATFAACRHLLEPGGFIAIIDVFLAENESREAYLDRWIEYADGHYAALQPEEKRLLFDHVRARDYPVSVGECRALAREADLRSFDVLLEDAPRLNRLVTMS